jgi:hypothetical protein
VLRQLTPGGHKLWTLHQGIKGGSNTVFWPLQPLPPPRTTCLMSPPRTTGQKTSARIGLKTGLRQASQSILPKQSDIAQNIIMDAAGSSSGSRFGVFSISALSVIPCQRRWRPHSPGAKPSALLERKSLEPDEVDGLIIKAD